MAKTSAQKIILFIALPVVLAAGYFIYNYLYHGHRDIDSEDAKFTLTVKELEAAFVTNESLANKKYSNQTIEVDGKVTAFDAASGTVTIDEKLSAVLQKNEPVATGKTIKVKGRFLGYDDLVEELKMDQVSLQK